MKFSSQEEYGIRCLLAIAKAKPGEATIPEIARTEGLSEAYVGKLLMILRKAGVITSTRGHIGGYALANEPHKISVGSVLEELGGKLFDDDFCEKHSGTSHACAHSTDCSIRWIWSSVQEAVDQVLDNLTLADVISGSQSLIQLQSEVNRPVAASPSS